MPKNHTKNSVNHLSFGWILMPPAIGFILNYYSILSVYTSIAVVLSSIVVLSLWLVYQLSNAPPVRKVRNQYESKVHLGALPEILVKEIHNYLIPKDSLALASVEYGNRTPELLAHTLKKLYAAQVMPIKNNGNSLMVATAFHLWYCHDQGFDREYIESYELNTGLKQRPKQILLDNNFLFILTHNGSVYATVLIKHIGQRWWRCWPKPSVAKMLARQEKDDWDLHLNKPILTGVQKIAMSTEREECVVVALKNGQLYVWGNDSDLIVLRARTQQHRPTLIPWSHYTNGTNMNKQTIIDFTYFGDLFVVLTNSHLYIRTMLENQWRSYEVRNSERIGLHCSPFTGNTYLVYKDAVVSYIASGRSTIICVFLASNQQERIDLRPRVLRLDSDILASSFSELYGVDARMVFRTKDAVFASSFLGSVRSLFEIKDFPELGAIHQMQAAYDAVYFLCKGGTVSQYHYASETMKKVEFSERIVYLSPRSYGYRYTQHVDKHQVIACGERSLSLYGICDADNQGNIQTIVLKTLSKVKALKKKLDEQGSSVCNIFWKKPNETFRSALKMLEDEGNNSQTKQPG